ncbi:uncharacterized protein LOC113351348 [Papaver somniferum]|uniref:uncharacterized protein LOC113351348 n=1 Tax=Papaver somniferum TaxID=3469 RepID=UPI000E70054F|nr:uncharacterized protein LOC113351348 [Papaver somniferum]
MDTSKRIKLFIWKCLQDALPTRLKLGIKENCVFCQQKEESTFHLFFDCDYAKAIWNLQLVPLQGVFSDQNSNNISFLDIYNVWLTGEVNSISMALAATKCWFIWKERCLRVFENKKRTPDQSALVISKHYEYWHPVTQNITSTHDKTTTDTKDIWKFPITRSLKINCDASWLSSKTDAGTGFILRNWTGTFKGAGMAKCRTSSAEEAEALALLHKTEWAITEEFQNLVIEGDNKATINYLLGQDTTISWQSKVILEEVKKKATQLVSFGSFQLVNKKGNKAEDILAKKGRKEAITTLSFYEAPLFLIPTTSYDTVKALELCNISLTPVSFSVDAYHTDSPIGRTTLNESVPNETESAD